MASEIEKFITMFIDHKNQMKEANEPRLIKTARNLTDMIQQTLDQHKKELTEKEVLIQTHIKTKQKQTQEIEALRNSIIGDGGKDFWFKVAWMSCLSSCVFALAYYWGTLVG